MAQTKIKSPDDIWKDFESYNKWAKSNPYQEHDFVGGKGIEVYRKKERPLTLVGFFAYCAKACGISSRSLRDYFYNRDKRYEEFVEVCDKIRDCIAADEIDGAMTGVYNATITARLNGLTENLDAKITGEVKSTIDVKKLSADELKTILEIQKKLDATDSGDTDIQGVIPEKGI